MVKEQTIMIVDDNREIVDSLAKLLEFEGYRVIKAYDGMEAMDRLEEYPVDLIILDVMMPRLNGLSAMMKIRRTKQIPIIILSAKTEESDMVSGLTMGADDYVTKPYQPAELLARVQAQLRRYLVWGKQEEKPGRRIVNGGLVLDQDSKTALADGKEIRLTAKEYRILELLIRYPGRVFSAEEIYERVWEEEAYSVENTVMVHIRRIREKVEINPKQPKYIKVVWGIGYKMEKF